VRANIEDDLQLASIQKWELDVWSHDSALVIGENDIRVNDQHISQLVNLGVQFVVLIPDLQKLMEIQAQELEETRSNAPLADFFTTYHTYAEILAYLVNITNVFSTISKYTPSIGKSVEGRDIPAVVVTGTATGAKKKIFINGGQHAREWIAPATVLYILEQLVSRYATDTSVKALLDAAEIHIIPLVNVDGYYYTWASTSNRLWRKNRRLNTGGSYGVDLNRNWDDHWGGEGSSGTPTSDTYRGTAPFSEPEAKAVGAYVTANGPFKGAIDYHSYSQLILRPYGWTNRAPTNDALAKTVGDTIRARILSITNVAYTSEPSWQLYYTSGSAQDWYFSQAQVPLSYTIELRDTGTYGFQLPAAQIKPTGQENWAGFLYFAQAVLANTEN